MKKINIYALIAAIIGALDSLYLTWVKLSHNEINCAPGLGDCFTVNTSRYSEIYGIPIAIFGLATFCGTPLTSGVGTCYDSSIDERRGNRPFSPVSV